jgi:hypothetical protein
MKFSRDRLQRSGEKVRGQVFGLRAFAL